MERIRNLETFQKVMLIISVLLVLVFSVIYPIVISRVGFEYMGSILVPEQSGGTVYSGRIGGAEASFVVSATRPWSSITAATSTGLTQSSRTPRPCLRTSSWART